MSDRIAGCFGGLCPCLRDAYSPPPLHVSPASKAQETIEDRGQVEAQIRSLRRSILRRRGTPEANPQARKKTDKVLSHYEEVLQSLEVRLKELDHELHELGSGRVILSKIWSATARSI
ncbi:unnamed protein product [Durusdinium trenchii]|uniref:Uncharacterized protein n=1 Tax=Durusdinium trenchii TaxID=1381693 RepID=A0ABP0NBT0_9DINO